MRKLYRWMFLFVAIIVYNTLLFADEIIQEVHLQPVHKDTPRFKRNKSSENGSKYQIKMVKVEGHPQIAVPPDTNAKVLYYGQTQLGIPPKEYGILVDFEAEEKMFWVDSDADGDFAEESPYLIFKSDRYVGGSVYYSPIPVGFRVKYTTGNITIERTIQFDLPYLVVVRAGLDDCLFLAARTWLTGVIVAGQDEYRIAIVDTNDNGIYNDPEDLLFIDEDFDLNFVEKEGKPLKRWKMLKFKTGEKYRLRFDCLPEKLILTKG